MNRVIYFVRNNWLLVVIVLVLFVLGYGIYRTREEASERLGAVSAKVAEVDGKVTVALFSLDAVKFTAEEDRKKLVEMDERTRAADVELSKQLADSAAAVAAIQTDVAKKADEERVDKIVAWSKEHADWDKEELAKKADKQYVDNRAYAASEDAAEAKKEAANAKWQLKKFKKELAEKEAAAQATATAETTPAETNTDPAVEPTTASAETGDSATPQTEIKWVRVSFQPAE